MNAYAAGGVQRHEPQISRSPYGLAVQGVPCSDGGGNGYAPVRKLRRLSALLLLSVVVAATVATTSASADSYMVTVRLDDGTVMTVIADLPAGATLTDAANSPAVPGTPI